MESEGSDIVSYFDQLPDEVKVKIFSYTNTPSIINFCEAYPSAEYLSHDKDIIHYVNFCKQYKCDGGSLNRFLAQKPRCQYITVLNINCLFWIPAGELRRCISKLPALECLYAVDTKLGVTEQDSMLYSSITKLKKIALSLLGEDFTVKSVMLFPNVIGLYFHVYGCTLNTLIYIKKLMNRMEQLEEVWLVDSGVDNKQMSNLLYHLPPWIKKATLVIHSYINIIRDVPHLTKIFESKKRATQLSFEKSDDSVDIFGEWKISDPIWNALLNEVHCEVPFGAKDARLLALNIRTLENIFFEELNFYHIDAVCCIRLQTLINKALTSQNTKYLKKLCINFCICDETWKRDPNLEPHQKKPKNEEGGKEAANLQSIVKHCPHIEELEIWGCEQAWSSSIPSLTYIKDLNKLKSLSLVDVPLQVDGSFLIDVCKSCLELRSLKISPLRLNTKINMNVREALNYACNLTDFRFEHMYIPVDQIIESFASQCKIERLFLKCTSVEKLTLACFENLVKNNPQLIFVMIVVKEMPKTKLRAVQNILNKHKNTPVRLFYCTQDESTFFGKLPIPAFHQYEIIKQETLVSVLDIFNGFT